MIGRSQIQGFLDQGRRIAERSVQGCNDTCSRSWFYFRTVSVREIY